MMRWSSGGGWAERLSGRSGATDSAVVAFAVAIVFGGR